MTGNARNRVVIERVEPEVDHGLFPIKRSVGEKVAVRADIFADGHDSLSASLLYKGPKDNVWHEAPMQFLENDRWEGTFPVEEIGIYRYKLMGWINYFRTWQRDLQKKAEANQDVSVDKLEGIQYIDSAIQKAMGKDKDTLQDFAGLLRKNTPNDELVSLALNRDLTTLMSIYSERLFPTEYEKELSVVVDRKKARFSAWYEIFPRSCDSPSGKGGTFKDCEKIIPKIAQMGFDVLYLTPIHPIGRTNRKGKNNTLSADSVDVGSPWAIGSDEGGHKAIHPSLGTMEDFKNFLNTAKNFGMEIAMDIAFQCSPDHPYIKEHPEWFKWRQDGTIHYAENPPKKYEDIVPLNFETEDWQSLWNELKSILVFWIDKGVKIFRVDNPHTKSFAFWEWLIKEIKHDYADVIFLAEAFTRPKVMYRLAKLGFTQSYTYFAWRNTKWELTQYINEIMKTEIREFFRPNFWPNTPDILPEHLQYGGRPAFMMRFVLAATLSSNYGIYGPAFELGIADAITGREEYHYSEKYEIKKWQWEQPGNLRDFIARVNKIRKDNPSLQEMWNLEFLEVDNEYLLFYERVTEDLSNILLIAVNLDPYHKQSGWVKVPIRQLGIEPGQSYLVHDLLGDGKYIWQGEKNYVELDPRESPAHIFLVRKRLKRETDFDYYM
jgi:starch synthase (maltosyl-transferring)